MGSAHATPGPAAIEQAQELLTRLVASGDVVALNLLGTVSEQPDFVAHSEALPFILSLRADADWKHAPQKSSGHKVSPLVLELWKALDQEGTLTASVARETLGRELTEAAVLRALCELWQALRISPAFAAEGQPTGWELMRVRHREALATGSATSQVTAISLLVSMYLQSVYAASSEEIEIFLSPLASRSRVREAVRGLSATRQIHSLSMDAQTYHFIEGGLPEFAEVAAPPVEKREHYAPAARPATPRRPLPAQRPEPTARPLRPAAATRSAPIFDRQPVEPAAEHGPRRKFVPEDRPAVRPASTASSPPAARRDRTDGKRPVRSGPPARFSRPQGDTPAWRGKDSETRPSERVRPGSRPPSPAGRSFSRPGASPRSGSGARPAGRSRGPGDFAPRPRPGQKSGFGSRPPRGPGDGSFRGPQKYPDRPAARTGASGAREPFRPRGEQKPGGSGGTSSYRPQGRPPAGTAARPSGPAAGRPASSFRPRAPQGGRRPAEPGRKPPYRPQGRPPAGTAARPSASAGGRPASSFRPRAPQDGQRPAEPGRKPPYRPQGRPAGTAGRPSPSASNRPASSFRPRAPQDGQKFPRAQKATGAPPNPGRTNRTAGPPFAGKPKPWSRAGSAAQKPRGKPGASFGKPPASSRGRKPDRKKPGA
jgi:23S rRNA pseudouridine2605 synthase